MDDAVQKRVFVLAETLLLGIPLIPKGATQDRPSDPPRSISRTTQGFLFPPDVTGQMVSAALSILTLLHLLELRPWVICCERRSQWRNSACASGCGGFCMIHRSC